MYFVTQEKITNLFWWFRNIEKSSHSLSQLQSSAIVELKRTYLTCILGSATAFKWERDDSQVILTISNACIDAGLAGACKERHVGNFKWRYNVTPSISSFNNYVIIKHHLAFEHNVQLTIRNQTSDWIIIFTDLALSQKPYEIKVLNGDNE
jgi:hypothetical protein